jgi:threonine 3-dehydrogenase
MMLSAGKLDIKPVITHLFPIEEFRAAFDLLTANPRECAKIVLFPDKSELEAAKRRMSI